MLLSGELALSEMMPAQSDWEQRFHSCLTLQAAAIPAEDQQVEPMSAQTHAQQWGAEPVESPEVKPIALPQAQHEAEAIDPPL